MHIDTTGAKRPATHRNPEGRAFTGSDQICCAKVMKYK